MGNTASVEHREDQDQRRRRRRRRRHSKDWPVAFTNEFGPFIHEFDHQKLNMLQLSKILRENGDQLYSSTLGATTSSVVQSRRAVGGVLAIVGLALTPYTGRVSLALTVTGIGLGVASGIKTAAIETGANTQEERARENFKKTSECLKKLQDCLKKVKEDNRLKAKTDLGETNLSKQMDDIIVMMAQESKAVTNMLRLFEGICEVAARSKKSFSRSRFIKLNDLFNGPDIFCIQCNSIQLAEGYECNIAKLIQGRTQGWQSLLGSLQEFYDLVKSHYAV